MRKLLVLSVLIVARTGWADRDSDAQRAFSDALRREASGDSTVLDAFEAIGAASPSTIWSDDAYVHAARLAEQRGQHARARSNYEKAIALGGDTRLAARARSELARLTANTGGGRWDNIAAEHERLVSVVYGGRTPETALRELEALISANPEYPRRVGVVLTIAEGWEREGQAERSIKWLSNTRLSDPQQQRQLDIALMYALIRHRDLERANQLLHGYRSSSTADPTIIRELDQALERERHRRWLRRFAWGVICLIAVAAVADLRRAAGNWRTALRIVRRPPTEVLFMIPVATVLALAATTGNVLVAPAVWQILACGLIVAWTSGSLLVARAASGAISAWRIVAHAVAAIATLLAVAYVALDHEALLDLIRETIAHGPAAR